MVIGVQTLIATLIIALVAGKPVNKPQPITPQPPMVEPVKPDEPRPPNPAPPAPKAEPGDNVKWVSYQKKQDFKDADCGPVLTDIEQHIDPKHKGQYRFPKDLTTWGHETTHGINSDLRMSTGKVGVNGFYCLENRAYILPEPKLTISDVAPLVPKAVRGSRYDLYLFKQAKDWNDMPTYIMDEWVAYTNGCEVGADQIRNNLKGQDNTSDEAIGPMEFTYYTLALCQAIKKHDPDYFKNNPNFSEFVAFNVRRAVKVHKELIVHEKFKWDTKLITTFIESEETADLKAMAVELWGKAFVDKYLLNK